MNSAPPTATDEARRLYAEKLRRAECLSLAKLFGLSTPAARALIEGPHAIVKGKTYGKQKRKYFAREELIAACL